MKTTIFSLILISTAAHAAVYSFHDGTEYASRLDGTQTSITLSGTPTGQLTITALSGTSGAPILKEGGGGKTSGAGIDSKGANSADNSSLIEQQKAPQIYNEGLAFSFQNAEGHPADARLISFEVTAFDPGGTVEIFLNGETAPSGSLDSNNGSEYAFPDHTVITAGNRLKLLAGPNSRFRLRSIEFEIAGEGHTAPATTVTVDTAPIPASVQQQPVIQVEPQPPQTVQPKTIGLLTY